MAYERWDRDRFERERDYDQREYYYAPAPERSRPAPRESERIFFEEDRKVSTGPPALYRPRREDVRYYDDRETVVERAGDMVPYRERREDDREIDIRYRRESRPFTRPQFVRRQSSLDTHDRRPMPRYGDHEREEIVMPAPPRRRSPPRFVERDYEDIRIEEPEYYGDDAYHPYAEREREIVRRRYPEPRPGEEIVYEREEVVKNEYPKRGKTRMPKRLINIRAIMDLGYDFEEEDTTIIIKKALGKENIDEVVRISRKYNAEPLPPPPLEQSVPPVAEEEIIKRRTEIIKENPSLVESSSSSSRSSSPTVVSRKTHKSHKSKRSSRSTHRSKSHRRHRSASFSESTASRDLVIREPSRHRTGPHGPHSTALIIPRRDEKYTYRRIEDELRALELERKALQLEREREGHDLTIEKEYKDGTIEIKKDRRGPNPAYLKAMMATLT